MGWSETNPPPHFVLVNVPKYFSNNLGSISNLWDSLNNLARQACEHKQALINGFTKWYGVHQLVYYETFPGIGIAIAREKALKNWKRKWKLRLIKESNPEWRDLFGELHWLEANLMASKYQNIPGLAPILVSGFWPTPE